MPEQREDRGPLAATWPWILLLWGFFALLGYHLIVQHRAHLWAVLPYLLAGAALPVVVAVAWRLVRCRRHRSA